MVVLKNGFELLQWKKSWDAFAFVFGDEKMKAGCRFVKNVAAAAVAAIDTELEASGSRSGGGCCCLLF